MDSAWEELERLLSDPDLARRCRQAATIVFSLESGTRAYSTIYADILAKDVQ
jgi:hypothetical protein